MSILSKSNNRLPFENYFEETLIISFITWFQCFVFFLVKLQTNVNLTTKVNVCAAETQRLFQARNFMIHASLKAGNKTIPSNRISRKGSRKYICYNGKRNTRGNILEGRIVETIEQFGTVGRNS